MTAPGPTTAAFTLSFIVVRQTLYNTFIFTFGSQFLGLILGKFGALLLLRPFRGRKIVRALVILPWAVPIALATVAWEWMFDFALQPHQLGADRARHRHPLGRAKLARHAASGNAVGDCRQCLAFLPVCDRNLPRRHYRGPAGRARRGDC